MQLTSGIGQSDDELMENIRYAFSLGLPELELNDERNGEFVIVASGPSLKDNLSHLQRLQAQDAHICVVNSAHDFCLSRGIRPNSMLILDAGDTMAPRHLTEPRHGITYYVCSHCPKSVFDALDGFEIVLVHMLMGRSEKEVIAEINPDAVLITGYRSAALRAYPLGHCLGYRSFHMFGVDSSFDTGGPTHVSHSDRDLVDVWQIGYLKPDGTTIERETSMQMSLQVEDFEEMIQLQKPKLVVYGTGLLPAIWETYYDETGEYRGRN